MIYLGVIIFLLVILLQAGCARIAFKSYIDFYSNGSTKFWWWLWTAFILMTIRRISAMLVYYGVAMPDLGIIDTMILPLIISYCLYLGMRHSYFYTLNKNKKIDYQLNKLRELTHKLRHFEK